MKPKYYQVVWGDSTSDLCEKVMTQMRFEWVPTGGVSSHLVETFGLGRQIFIQAMVKE